MLLLVKIMLWIIAIVLFSFFILVAFANGVIKGIKLLSIKDLKRSKLEDLLIRQTLKKGKNVDPYFHSLYVQHEIQKKTKEQRDKIKKENKNGKK